LRAFTPRDQRAVKTAAETMRPNPGLDIVGAITELGVGEALISMLDAKGTPTPTERVWMLAPGSRIGPATDAERQAIRAASLLGGKYDKVVDRESAYENLQKRIADQTARAPDAGKGAAGAAKLDAGDGLMGAVSVFFFGSTGPRGGRRDGVVQSVVKSMVRRTATQLVRGALGSLIGKR
jgi:DNA helicase HerA-like ATPase